MKKHVGPIIAVIVLLLPILYLASYFVLVVPSGVFIADPASPYSYEQRSGNGYMKSYRTATESTAAFPYTVGYATWEEFHRAWTEKQRTGNPENG